MFVKLTGSITVFAALCMGVVIMMLSVIIQSVAVHSGMHIANESTRLACKAVMGGFNREIFENYHIFVMDLGYGQSKADKNRFKDSLNSYLTCDTPDNNDVNLTGASYGGINDIRYTYITDGKGEYFTDQVVQYMKYKVSKDFVTGYLSKFGLMANNKSVLEAGKQQASLAGKSDKISEDIMKLYSCVDGFKVKGTQAVYDSDGDLEFNDKFLKIIVSDNTSKEAMGYSENDFYNTRKNKSFCLLYKMGVLQKQLRRWMTAIDDNNSDRKKFCKKKCKSICEELERSLDISIDCCDEALGIIKKIENDRKKYNEQKEEYEKYLNEHKDELGQDVYDGFSIAKDDIAVPDNLDELKVSIEDNKEKLLQMKDTLDFTLKNDKGSLNHSLAVAELIIMYAKDYSVENICFNYENLEMECDSEGIVKSLLGIFEEGIISLVTDTDKLSKTSVKSGGLVSKNCMSYSKSSVADMIEDALDEGIIKLPGNVYYAVKSMLMEVKDIENLLLVATDEIIDRILMNEYIMESFNHYSANNEDVNVNINNVLEYEAEYIIAGNMTDMANIKAVVNRLIMIRTIMNYISIVSDPARHYEAKGIAMSLVGFTSMPVIVNVATCIVEVLWAYEESLVDCNALLKGYYVPVAKQGSQLKIGIGELLLLSKTLINKKAQSYSSNKNVFGMLDYKSYLELILLLTPKEEKSLRCMDLIQVNINNTYGTNMRMTNAVYAVSTKIKYNIRMMFLNMNQMKTLNKDMTGIREYISAGAFSY